MTESKNPRLNERAAVTEEHRKWAQQVWDEIADDDKCCIGNPEGSEFIEENIIPKLAQLLADRDAAQAANLRLSEEQVRRANEFWNMLPHCCGYPDCDGDLVAENHSEKCPLFNGRELTHIEFAALFKNAMLEETPAPEESRSVQKRKAAQRGEPMPTFVAPASQPVSAPAEMKEETCGTAKNVRISTSEDSTANHASNSDFLMPDPEWNGLKKETQEKVRKWFDLAAKYLQAILDEPERIELAEVRAALKEAKWWEHLSPDCTMPYSENHNCLYCQRIAELRAREAELQGVQKKAGA